MDSIGRSVLSYAAKSSNEELFAAILGIYEAAADLPDQNGRTPLMHAAMHGKIAAMRTLLSRNDVDWMRKDNRGRKALAYAAQRGHNEAVELLLENDLAPNDRDTEGRTALSLAAERGRVVVVQTLLRCSTVIDTSPDNSDKTPMDYAMEQRRLWDEVMFGDHWEVYDEILLALDRYKVLDKDIKME